MSDRQPIRPLRLSDDGLRIVRDYAKPLLPSARGRFLEHVARLLEGKREVGPGTVARACREAQRDLLARSEASAIDGTG
jgi:hypothetical protein